LCEPFRVKDNPGTEAACIPLWPSVPTRKAWYHFQLAVTLNANGAASLVYAPSRLASDYSGAYDTNCSIYYTTSSWTGTGQQFLQCDSFSTTAPLTGVASSNMPTDVVSSQLMYADPVIENGVLWRYRTVFAGIRVRPMGPQATLAGILSCYQTPDHSSLSNIVTSAITMQPSYTQLVPKMDKWATIAYAPVLPEEYDLRGDYMVNSSVSLSYNAASVLQQGAQCNHSMGFVYYGGTPGNTIMVEVVQGVELIGATVPGKTKTPTDVVGVSMISNAVTPDNITVLNQNPKVVERMAQVVPQSTEHLQAMNPTVDGLHTAIKTGGEILSFAKDFAGLLL